MYNTSKGFTYVETIFALAIFLICALSIYAIYNQIANNVAYAQKNYKASLIAENILEEVKANVNNQLLTSTEITVAPDLADFLGKSDYDFDKLYDSDNYNIAVAICKIKGNGEFTTDYFSGKGDFIDINLSSVSIDDKTGKQSFYDINEIDTQSNERYNYLIQIKISDKNDKLLVNGLTDIFIACP